MVIIGYDPGGNGRNGVAILDCRDRRALTATVNTVDTVDDALNWFGGSGHDKFDAAGIDTLLSWGTCAGGWRPMDMYLRQTYPVVATSVMSPNALRGAMAIQGMAMAMKLKSIYKDIELNETHPKILYYALTQRTYSFGPNMINWLLNQIGVTGAHISSEHEWDALISAWATYLGCAGTWTNDLIPNGNNLLFPVGRVTYYWT